MRAHEHPLVRARVGERADAERLLSELSQLGQITLRRLAPTRKRPICFEVAVQLPFERELVQAVTQYGSTLAEAGASCLLGALIELDRHLRRGERALGDYLAEFAV